MSKIKVSSKSIDSKWVAQYLFYTFAACVFLSISLAIFFEELLILGLPVVLLVLFLAFIDYKSIFLFLFFCIPFSTEVFFSDSLATDFPTEPMIVGLMFIYLILILFKPKSIDQRVFRHPITLLLLVHIGWITVSVFTSSSVMVSFKFLLAKIWYFVTFFLMAAHLLKDEKNILKLLWLFAIPLTIATTKVIIHHAMLDFGFKAINTACPPFFRNHVNYAAILTVFFPFLIYLRRNTDTMIKRRLIDMSIIIITFGIITAFTRAAYVALLMIPAVYVVIRLKLTRIALVLSSFLIFSMLIFLTTKNKFLELVPTTETVSHTEFGEIVYATSELKDVSTMERYYRWIAGFQMVLEKPILGFGPGNFYGNYKQYALERFSTYVSDNPERSGVHNYYLMTAIEQGLIGLIIFLVLTFFSILYGQKVYHQTIGLKRKELVMSFILSLVVIDAFLLMNDMIETCKIGSFYFMNLSAIVIIDLNNRSWSKELKKIQD